MARPANPRYVQVKEPATGGSGDDAFVLHPGEVFRADHELAQKYPHLFKPLESTRQRPDVEQMTAAPGEKRG